MCTQSVYVPPMVGSSLLLLHGFWEGLSRRQKHYLRRTPCYFLPLFAHDRGYCGSWWTGRILGKKRSRRRRQHESKWGKSGIPSVEFISSEGVLTTVIEQEDWNMFAISLLISIWLCLPTYTCQM